MNNNIFFKITTDSLSRHLNETLGQKKLNGKFFHLKFDSLKQEILKLIHIFHCLFLKNIYYSLYDEEPHKSNLILRRLKTNKCHSQIIKSILMFYLASCKYFLTILLIRESENSKYTLMKTGLSLIHI